MPVLLTGIVFLSLVLVEKHLHTIPSQPAIYVGLSYSQMQHTAFVPGSLWGQIVMSYIYIDIAVDEQQHIGHV